MNISEFNELLSFESEFYNPDNKSLKDILRDAYNKMIEMSEDVSNPTLVIHYTNIIPGSSVPGYYNINPEIEIVKFYHKPRFMHNENINKLIDKFIKDDIAIYDVFIGEIYDDAPDDIIPLVYLYRNHYNIKYQKNTLEVKSNPKDRSYSKNIIAPDGINELTISFIYIGPWRKYKYAIQFLNYDAWIYADNYPVDTNNIKIDIRRYNNITTDFLNFIICIIIGAFGSLYKEKLNFIFEVTATESKVNKEMFYYLKSLHNKKVDLSEYSGYCKYSKKEPLCLKHYSYMNSLLNKIKQSNYNTKEDKKIVQEYIITLWMFIYNKHNNNKYFDVNLYLQNYLIKYTNLLLTEKSCYLGDVKMLNMNSTIYITETVPIKRMLEKFNNCKHQTGIIGLSFKSEGNGHSNTLILEKENNQVIAYRYEPNGPVLKYPDIKFPYLMEDMVKKYLLDHGVIYRSFHKNSCGIYHSGLCQFISKFQIIYGNIKDEQKLKQFVIDFFDWLINTELCNPKQLRKERALSSIKEYSKQHNK